MKTNEGRKKKKKKKKEGFHSSFEYYCDCFASRFPSVWHRSSLLPLPTTAMAAEEQEAALPRELTQPVQTDRPADAPRRCFICLTDQDPSDALDSWVDPCPCTLEAHQDCMLSWVVDCERTSKPLKCPVCKSAIEMEGPWDLLVTLNDLIQKRFTKASPYILFTGVAMGVQFSLQMYGALAMWSFSGKDTMIRFLLGPGMMLDARNGGTGVRLVRDKIWSSLVMMNVAPTLLFGQLLPNLSNNVFLPVASLVSFSTLAFYKKVEGFFKEKRDEMKRNEKRN